MVGKPRSTRPPPPREFRCKHVDHQVECLHALLLPQLQIVELVFISVFFSNYCNTRAKTYCVTVSTKLLRQTGNLWATKISTFGHFERFS